MTSSEMAEKHCNGRKTLTFQESTAMAEKALTYQKNTDVAEKTLTYQKNAVTLKL